MKKTIEQEIKEKELHEFLTNPVGFIKGFLSRRQAANEDLRSRDGASPSTMAEAAERAAAYNKLFNAAVEAFKGNTEGFKAMLGEVSQ